MSAAPHYTSSAARVWHAYYSLPRDEKGAPPAIRSLEVRYGIAHATLNKLLDGRAKAERTNYARLERVADALCTTPDWLLYGKGKAPLGKWPIPPWPGPKKKSTSGTMPAVKVSK